MAIAGAGGIIGYSRPLRRGSRAVHRRRLSSSRSRRSLSRATWNGWQNGWGGARVAALYQHHQLAGDRRTMVLLAYAVMRPLVLASQLPTRGGLPLAMGLICRAFHRYHTQEGAYAGRRLSGAGERHRADGGAGHLRHPAYRRAGGVPRCDDGISRKCLSIIFTARSSPSTSNS